MRLPITVVSLAVLLCCCASARPAVPIPPSASSLAADLRGLIERYESDRGALLRFWSVASSPQREARLEAFTRERLSELEGLAFDTLDPEQRIDWILLKNELERELAQLPIRAVRRAEIASLLGFAPGIIELVEATRQMQPLDAERSAEQLETLKAEVVLARKEAPEKTKTLSKSISRRAAASLDELRGELDEWNRFRKGYDPNFTWWIAKPCEALRSELEDYAKYLREEVAGLKGGDDEPIVGDPIGREALLGELGFELIAYSPEELIEIAEREFAWCEKERLAASRALGCGDDWRAALEQVKRDHVPPGEQPALIRKLALEATDYVEQHQLVSVPPLCKETWRMLMMTPERQLVSPFFTGGEVISVSFPTDGMTHEQKQMSLRGNNVHFSRATVHHELIPGHHLQGFMAERYQRQRRLFATPFYTEGWALWWELLLWERGFAETPADKLGMLFWRMHRCARIKFSLAFHLGTLTPEQCIEFLVDKVGHERRNATAEVRRSFNGSYAPLYQLAYMTGALQLRALHQETVGAGKLSEREFHDSILQGGNMPIEMVRARVAKLPLSKDWKPTWRFCDG